jgi:4-hydroxy-tetrahydrodipicolinate synthase
MNPKDSLHGTLTAIVTPFRDDAAQSIDWQSLDALVDRQIEGGVDGLVPCGTTGEAPSLSDAEQLEVIQRIVERARGRVSVVAGTGTNSTASTVARCKQAERAGANAVMVVCPYYNKPSQAGLLRHFLAAAEAVSCPLVVYNIPSRSGVDVLPETLEELARRAESFVAVKEATGNVLRTQTLVRRLGDRISVLSGDDALTLPIIASGGRGVISVTSNLLPAEVVRATSVALAGRLVEARALHLALLAVHEAMFLEPNPAPVKAALAMERQMGDGVRGPLVSASMATREAITRALLELRRRPPTDYPPSIPAASGRS